MTEFRHATTSLSRRRFLQTTTPLFALASTQLLAACQAPSPASPTTPAPTSAPKPAGSPAVSPAPLVASPAASPAASPIAIGGPVANSMYQINAQHTGRSPYAGRRRAVLARTFDTARASTLDAGNARVDVQSAPTIGADSTIYISNFQGNLFALRDPGSGDALEVVWHFHPARLVSLHATPAIGRDGTVYLGFSGERQPGQVGGALYAVRAPSSGTEATQVWTADLGDGRITASPTIADDGTIYIVSGSGTLTAVTPAGQIKWAAQVGPALKGSPGIAPDGTVYAPSMDGKLYAVKPPSDSGQEGAVKWTFDFGDHLGPTPLVTNQPAPGAPGGGGGANGIGTGASPMIAPDGMIYIGANNSNLYAIRPDGTQAWVYEAERELAGIWTTPSLSADGQTIYFGANKGGIYALNRADGKLRWQFNIFGSVYSSTTLDGSGTLYTGSTVGHVFAIDSTNGQQIFDYDAGRSVWSAPAIRPDGSLVVADRGGKVLLFAAS